MKSMITRKLKSSIVLLLHYLFLFTILTNWTLFYQY